VEKGRGVPEKRAFADDPTVSGLHHLPDSPEKALEFVDIVRRDSGCLPQASMGCRHPHAGRCRVGDVVVPSEQEIEGPSILGFPAPHLPARSRKIVVAENLETAIPHGETNSRVRGLLDDWPISRRFDFSGEVLLGAVQATFSARGTEVDAPVLPVSRPPSLKTKLGRRCGPGSCAEVR
jgi:hypothetical protein